MHSDKCPYITVIGSRDTSSFHFYYLHRFSLAPMNVPTYR